MYVNGGVLTGFLKRGLRRDLCSFFFLAAAEPSSDPTGTTIAVSKEAIKDLTTAVRSLDNASRHRRRIVIFKEPTVLLRILVQQCELFGMLPLEILKLRIFFVFRVILMGSILEKIAF